MRKRAPDPQAALLFDWQDKQPRGLRLALACVVTFSGLAVLFIIFRVVTPEARPITTRPQQMIVLNPAVPAERALIHQAMDRSFPLLPTESAALTAVPPGATLPKFEPGISTFELKLKPLTSGMTMTAKPKLFALDVEVLPPLPKAEPGPGAGAGAQVLHLRAEGAGAARLRSGTALAEIPLMDAARPRFRLAVGRMGEVMMALPVGTVEDAALMARLHAALMRLRFAPAKQELEWVDVGFGWEGRGPS